MSAPGFLTGDQAAELLKKLPDDQKYSVLLSLAKDTREARGAAMAKSEQRLREAAKQKGLNWDQMSEESRIEFVDTLVHESRA